MAELHELQPVPRMRMILKATPLRLHSTCTMPTLTPIYQVNKIYTKCCIKTSRKATIYDDQTPHSFTLCIIKMSYNVSCAQSLTLCSNSVVSLQVMLA